MTIALHILWIVFLGALVLAAAGDWSGLFKAFTYETLIGTAAAPIFVATPFVTLVALRMKAKMALKAALACNLISLFYGVGVFLAEASSSNAMVLLAVASPVMIVIASLAGLATTFRLLKHMGQTHGA